MFHCTRNDTDGDGRCWAGGECWVDLLAGDVEVDGLDDPVELVRHRGYAAGEALQAVGEGLQVALKLKLQIVLTREKLSSLLNCSTAKSGKRGAKVIREKEYKSRM